jgi:DNA-binding NarL/FixJ family response regulator
MGTMRQRSRSAAGRAPSVESKGVAPVFEIGDHYALRNSDARPGARSEACDRCGDSCGLATKVGATVLALVAEHLADRPEAARVAEKSRAVERGTGDGAAAKAGTIRVLLVDDHELIRQGLRRILEQAPGHEVVGEADSVAEAKTLVRSCKPDVAIVDTLLPDGGGLSVVADIRSWSSTVGIVVMATANTDEQLIGALQAGASGLVAKSAGIRELLAAVAHSAQAPEVFNSRQFADVMRRRSRGGGPSLSAREREVLAFLAQGMSAAEIAERMFVAESTIKGNMAKLYSKLEATNRAQVIMAGVRHGYIWA